MKVFKFIGLVVFVLVFYQSYAQKPGYSIRLVAVDYLSEELGWINKKHSGYAIDSNAVDDTLKNILNNLRMNGYMAASIDSVLFDTTNVIVNLFIGDQYSIKNLGITGINLDAEKLVGLDKNQSEGETYSFADLDEIKQQILTYCENTGYPFARIIADQFIVHDKQLSLRLNVEKGIFFTIDTIVIKGESKIKSYFINRYIRIKPASSTKNSKLAS